MPPSVFNSFLSFSSLKLSRISGCSADSAYGYFTFLCTFLRGDLSSLSFNSFLLGDLDRGSLTFGYEESFSSCMVIVRFEMVPGGILVTYA